MSRCGALLLLVLAGSLVVAAPRLRTPDPRLPMGTWRVEFSNGVIERCEIGADGKSTVAEPLRSAPGKWSVQDGVVVIVSDDDRLERWQRVEGRWIVEHWCPVSAYPKGPSVRGAARPTR